MINIKNEFLKMHPWMLQYLWYKIRRASNPSSLKPTHIFLSICDHFEPLWNGVDIQTGSKRVKAWCDAYPSIAGSYRDADGCSPKYSFFFPEEEYRKEYLDMLAELCGRGYGEVEIHLHHDNDKPENLIRKLNGFKDVLAKQHGLLSKDRITGEIKYGFIHGNWALDNSRPDGRCCGINNELDILQKTGCYADFTMPSAPDVCQTTKINSIYYAIDDPCKPKSHNSGLDARRGGHDQDGLLMVQGPLSLNWGNRKMMFLPRIENGCLSYDCPVTLQRIKLWLETNVHIIGMENFVFVKIHTHGSQENNINYLLTQGGLHDLFSLFQKHFSEDNGFRLHYVSARELVNVIKAIEDDAVCGAMEEMRDYRYVLLSKKAP